MIFCIMFSVMEPHLLVKKRVCGVLATLRTPENRSILFFEFLERMLWTTLFRRITESRTIWIANLFSDRQYNRVTIAAKTYCAYCPFRL
ncbi:hypothetical protein HCUR_01457 [Holospora curviuscula]|uniref:Uncharacterized protein n=1 Tax=Holospora curviuscula TaxID=1082868 RepID=A0A2S5R744_9PROT|nr:hypothetical protein HCUR_01457 [Holospora curviuscula]